MEDEQVIEVVVALRIKGDADIAELIAEMDYQFTHDAIIDTEIRDVFTEV
jgi:hypothetical protein